MKRILSLLTLLAIATGTARAELQVTTLHPLLTELAEKVGGEHVSVTGLMKAGANVHDFRPNSSDMTKLRASDFVLASGKGMEVYLPRLQQGLPSTVEIIQVGNNVRSLKVESGSSVFVCCPDHAAGSVDPHWWHSISGMKKAVDVVAKKFSSADKANAAAYKANAAAWKRSLDELAGWAKREVAKVPRKNRVLVTAHAAFGYFCREHGFRAIPLGGLSAETATSKYISDAIAQIKKFGVVTVFPESNANSKALNAIKSSTGVKIGGELIADGAVTSYDTFVRRNVGEVVKGLR